MKPGSTDPSARSTPLLDRLAPIPPPATSRTSASQSRRFTWMVVFVLALIIGWIASMFWSGTALNLSSQITAPAARFMDSITEGVISNEAPYLSLLLWVAYPWLSIIAAVVVHELGHVCAGWCAKLKLVMVRFGPIQINPPFQVTFQRNQLSRVGGWTSMVPIQGKGIRFRLLVLVLGGPAANLLTGLAIIFFMHKIPAFLGWFSFMSVVTGMGNLVPFQRLGLMSDGKRILMLLRGGGRGERWMANVQLAAELRNGVLPENLTPEFLAMATAIRDESPDTVISHLFAYSSSWYAGSDDKTANYLEVCLQYSHFAGSMLREALVADAGVFQGRRRKRADLARDWLADLPEKTQLPWLRQRVQAAICEAEGDFQGSLDKLREVETALAKLPDRQQRAISLKSLERWRSELQAELQSAMQPPVAH